jgi:lysozyme
MIMMTKEQFLKVKKSLILHEAERSYPYVDTVGKITIGIGYNLSDRGIDNDWIEKQFQEDVEYFYDQLCEFPWYHLLNEDRQIILIDMAFMGWKKFLEFDKMIHALEKNDYELAAQEMLNSKWAEEVKDRAVQLSYGMREGIYNVD